MKYIVTGGVGFIGSHLSEAFGSQGHELAIIDDLSSGRMENISEIINHPKVTFHQESILDRPLLKMLYAGVDGVFHQAALVSVPKSIDDPATSLKLR